LGGGGGAANDRKPYFGGSVEVLKVQKQLGRGQSEGVGKTGLLALSLLYHYKSDIKIYVMRSFVSSPSPFSTNYKDDIKI
jgi:hypothetical protein